MKGQRFRCTPCRDLGRIRTGSGPKDFDICPHCAARARRAWDLFQVRRRNPFATSSNHHQPAFGASAGANQDSVP